MKIPIITKRIKLDGDYEGGWVDIHTNPPSGELLDCGSAFESMDKKDVRQVLPAFCAMLKLSIQQWNLTDNKDKDLPLTKEAIEALPFDLIMQIAQKSIGVIGGVK